MIEAHVIAVSPVYAAPPNGVGAWRVTVDFHNHGYATFVHSGCEAPAVGDTWLMPDPRLAELVHRPHMAPDARIETRAPGGDR